jgi:hypothetical protein
VTDVDDFEVGIYRSTMQDILTDVAEAETLVHLMRAAHVTSSANSVTFLFLDD